MSLVGHWKLDGDASDSAGGNDGSGSPNYVDGKIGQGIDGDGSQIRVSSDSESIKSAFTGNQMTLSVWLRQYDHDTYRWSDILGMDGTRLERGRGDDGNPAGDYWCNLGTGDSAISGRENNVSNYDIGQPGNEWFHLLIRRAGDDYAVYINGERDSSCPVTGPMEISGDFIINESTSGVEIDDVRLYDHAISEKKIQQLSQAKVLHYKFDNFAEPTKNRSKGEGDHDWRGNNGSNTITKTDPNAPHPNVVRLEKDGSVDQWHGQHGRTDTYSLSVGDHVTFSGWYKLESGAGRTYLSGTNYEADGWSSHGGAGYTMENDGKWHRFEMTAEISGDSPSGEYQPAMSWGYSTNQQWLELCGVQIETKDHATPFVKNQRGGVVTDSSGQGNDATFGLVSSDFEDGTVGDWNVSNGYIKSDTSVSGDYSFGTDGQGGIRATLSPEDLSGGEKIDSFSFWWWEETHQSGHRVTLEDSSGNDVMYSETENYQWVLSNSGGEDYIRNYDGMGYQIWTHFEFWFDWRAGTYDYRLSTIDGEYVSTGTQSLNNTTGVETVRLHHPTGSGNYNRFDDFRITYNDTESPQWVEDSKVGSGAYEFDGDNDNIDLPPTAIPTGNEVTVSFWSYGGSELPISTSILEAKDSGNNRVLNIHHPWDNGNVYWDTDNGGSGIDRIYKSANSSDYKGRWAHWTFTKDANTGDQKIYLDGELWHSGTGKTGTLAPTDSASLGSYSDGQSNYWPGSVDDFRIYSTALSDDEVKEVYEQRASIDAGGNFHGHEFIESGYDGMIADYVSEWDVGTSGSQGSFSQNGSTSENDIITSSDPFGKEVPVWRCSPDSNSGGDGGWNMTFTGDNSDRLRFTVFVQRTGDSMNGSYYHGCHNGGNTLNLDGSTNGNPYFHSGNLPSLNNWYLLVGILHPNDYTGSNTGVSGVYDLNGTKVSGGSEYKWGSDDTQEMRDYLYYSTDTSERQYFVYPRVDVVDGTEPSISDLVNGLDSRLYDHISQIDTTEPQPMAVTPQSSIVSGLSEVGPASESLVGWWPLDGDTRDYSPYGRHGVEKNGVAITSGLGQSSYSFDGTDDYIRMPQDPYKGALDEQTAKMSLSGWLYPTGLQTNSTNHAIQNCWLGHSSTAYNDNMEMGVDASTNDIQVYFDTNGSDNTNTNTGVTAPLNTWTHVVVTLDLSGTPTMKLYKNGSLGLTDTSTWSGTNGTLDDAGAEFTIGASRSYREPYTGKIQDVRIYDRALTAEEIETLYNLTDPRKDQRVIQSPDGEVYTKNQFDETL